jgi:hypothetical protein
MPRDTSTPVPTADLVAVTGTLARVDQNVRQIKNDMLPPLVADTREARDKARAALGKIDEHARDTDAHDHGCKETARQEKQDDAIADMRPRIAGLDKWRWWLMGILLVGVSSAFGFALLSRQVSTENATRINATARDVDRHERVIDSVQKAQQRDRETYLRAVREIPSATARKVSATPVKAPSQEVVERAADDLPLRPHERRQLRMLMDRAREREANGEGNGGG